MSPIFLSETILGQEKCKIKKTTDQKNQLRHFLGFFVFCSKMFIRYWKIISEIPIALMAYENFLQSKERENLGGDMASFAYGWG